MITSAKRCLVLAAHPDDETLGAGGLIARLIDQGSEVMVAVATDGTSAQYANDGEAQDRRHAQFADALAILGVTKFAVGPFPDMRLDGVSHVELNRWVESIIETFQPDLVITHHPNDVNLDHRVLFESVLVATRPTPSQSVTTLLSFFVGSSTEWGSFRGSGQFVPNCFVDISDYLDRKVGALSAYCDELRVSPHPRSVDAVIARCVATGSEVGVAAAEGFLLHRFVQR